MSKLALFGGKPTFESPLNWHTFWPPVKAATRQKLDELYMSRRWTAFDGTETEFAQAFAQRHGCKHGIFTINGTVTLQCALGAYGIGPGDEVIVPALTWYATAMAATYLGATPVFVDIDRENLCIDPAKIEAAITPRTKAIIPVHLYGSMADMDSIMAIARRHNLKVIEDAAHMHGGSWGGRSIGSIGDVGSFSFQHSKTMSSAEGGICVTNDDDIAVKIFRMKQIGYRPGEVPGKPTDAPPKGLLCYPFRATAFQSLVLQEQLADLDALLDRYQRTAAALEARLKQSTKIRFQPRGRKADKQGYFGWVLIFDHPEYRDISRDMLFKALTAEGLQMHPTWGPVWKFRLFNLESNAYRIDAPCTVTEEITDRMLWTLHAYLGSEPDVVEKIGDAIEKVARNADELRRETVKIAV